LRDRGYDVDESVVPASMSTGTHSDQLAGVLNQPLFRVGEFLAYSPRLDEVLALPTPFLAMVMTWSGEHWVIVDAVRTNGVLIRDPGGRSAAFGDECVVDLGEFADCWKRCGTQAVVRVKDDQDDEEEGVR
jgi:ABC-type bacteriocin/lantibiotic exporter with double-glycine peptidase domain